ncbi:hypothetical protein BRARA_H00427 [Brassica rapa]|uniref:DUF4283 domain-containing protein n=1 Tax=Brassica campestris TaxID=3711 RepID=A0A397YF66_BRACM|nr:hypothetical protein BRARA_H00427 [Brassica rapa]
MISRRWNPGIRGFYEGSISQYVVNLRWLGLGKWYLGKSQRFEISLIWILISILFKTESNPYRGIVVLSFGIFTQRSGVNRKGNRDGFDVELIWEVWVLRLSWLKEIDSNYNYTRFCDNRRNHGNGIMKILDQYKRDMGMSFIISFKTFSLSLEKDQSFTFLLLDMTQSQLLGNVGEVKNAEGTRKRLKISVPHFDNSALIKTFSKTLLGRCMNPEKQEMKALISNMPKIWKLEEKVVGTDLGFGKFQFDFKKEEDMEGVLKLQPFHFDYWMLSLARWQPKKSLLYPFEIPFWVRVIGVPAEFKTEPTSESIGNAIGRTVAVDVVSSGGEFYDGEEAPVSLRYEKLFGYCQVCGSFCHKDEVCPLDEKNKKMSPERKQEGRDANGSWHEGGKHEDRARSYKGVVINGNAHNKERDGRDHYGKGKGKMVEEPEFKWINVSAKGNKKAYTSRGNYRGDGDASRNRPARREDTRGGVQNDQPREQKEYKGAREEAREEGEIRNAEERVVTMPSQKFQEELAKTQADGTEAISDPIEAEQGLVTVQGMVEDQGELDDEDVMDMDEIKAHLLENGIDMDAEDFMENCSEGEAEEVIKEGNGKEEEKVAFVEEEQGQIGGDAGKKHGLRKRLFKPALSTVGSSKMRVFNALESPRKRAVPKSGTRQGDTSKQTEIKGPLNPKSGQQKS